MKKHPSAIESTHRSIADGASAFTETHPINRSPKQLRRAGNIKI
jgi:hypothetical protein